MAHAKINVARMYDWIDRNLNQGIALPADAQIMERFGFDSPESARTLLAELADAGRITIKGYGETRIITLGRTKATLTPAPRPVPTAKRADPVIDAGIAKIAAIVARGGNAGSARAAQAADALKAARTKPAPPARLSKASPTLPVAAANSKEPAPMPAKTVQLPASAVSAINAVERLAAENSITIGGAAVLLIEQALAADLANAPGLALADVSVSDLLAELGHRLEEAEAVPDRTNEIAALTARAEAAEVALARIKAALAS